MIMQNAPVVFGTPQPPMPEPFPSPGPQPIQIGRAHV